MLVLGPLRFAFRFTVLFCCLLHDNRLLQRVVALFIWFFSFRVASLIWFDLLPMRAVVMLHRWHVQDNRWRIRSGSNDSRLSR